MEIRRNQEKCRGIWTKRMPALLFTALIILFAGRLLTGAPASAEEESEKISFRFIDNEEVRGFKTDYGFSEDRAWVRGLDQQTYLINPAGEIIYTVPKRVMIEGTSEEVVFERFYPVENGVAPAATRSLQLAATPSRDDGILGRHIRGCIRAFIPLLDPQGQRHVAP